MEVVSSEEASWWVAASAGDVRASNRLIADLFTRARLEQEDADAVEAKTAYPLPCGSPRS